jgi:hypothetical protein
LVDQLVEYGAHGDVVQICPKNIELDDIEWSNQEHESELLDSNSNQLLL